MTPVDGVEISSKPSAYSMRSIHCLSFGLPEAAFTFALNDFLVGVRAKFFAPPNRRICVIGEARRLISLLFLGAVVWNSRFQLAPLYFFGLNHELYSFKNPLGHLKSPDRSCRSLGSNRN
jgi:hypothetical protein